MAKELGDSGLSATILNNLGNLFITQRKYDEALGAYMESIALAKKSGNASAGSQNALPMLQWLPRRRQV